MAYIFIFLKESLGFLTGGGPGGMITIKYRYILKTIEMYFLFKQKNSL